jgi:hypothetical protein
VTVRADEPTPWQVQRAQAERTGALPTGYTHCYHRHFSNSEIHRDGGPECTQPGTPYRVYVFDDWALDEHEKIVAAYAAAHPDKFLPEADAAAFVDLMLAVLGGEGAEFMVSGAGSGDYVQLACRKCTGWRYVTGEIPLWEMMTDAREHWEAEHRGPSDDKA